MALLRHISPAAAVTAAARVAVALGGLSRGYLGKIRLYLGQPAKLMQAWQVLLPTLEFLLGLIGHYTSRLSSNAADIRITITGLNTAMRCAMTITEAFPQHTSAFAIQRAAHRGADVRIRQGALVLLRRIVTSMPQVWAGSEEQFCQGAIYIIQSEEAMESAQDTSAQDIFALGWVQGRSSLIHPSLGLPSSDPSSPGVSASAKGGEWGGARELGGGAGGAAVGSSSGGGGMGGAAGGGGGGSTVGGGSGAAGGVSPIEAVLLRPVGEVEVEWSSACSSLLGAAVLVARNTPCDETRKEIVQSRRLIRRSACASLLGAAVLVPRNVPWDETSFETSQNRNVPWDETSFETSQNRNVPWDETSFETSQNRNVPWDETSFETSQNRNVPWDETRKEIVQVVSQVVHLALCLCGVAVAVADLKLFASCSLFPIPLQLLTFLFLPAPWSPPHLPPHLILAMAATNQPAAASSPSPRHLLSSPHIVSSTISPVLPHVPHPPPQLILAMAATNQLLPAHPVPATSSTDSSTSTSARGSSGSGAAREARRRAAGGGGEEDPLYHVCSKGLSILANTVHTMDDVLLLALLRSLVKSSLDCILPLVLQCLSTIIARKSPSAVPEAGEEATGGTGGASGISGVEGGATSSDGSEGGDAGGTVGAAIGVKDESAEREIRGLSQFKLPPLEVGASTSVACFAWKRQDTHRCTEENENLP
ncbi:unnamed protein product, partial [Closterium sp. Naga37s-1]